MTSTPVPFSPYDARRPPVGVACQVSLVLLVASAITLAAQIPNVRDLVGPVLLCAGAWVAFVIGASMLARVGPFSWRVFRLVASRQLLVELVIAGMLEFIFIRDHMPARILVVFSLLVAVFCLTVALLIAFTVARYQDID